MRCMFCYSIYLSKRPHQMRSLENVNHADELSSLNLNLNWLSNYWCVINLIRKACRKNLNMKLSQREKRFDIIKMSFVKFQNLKVRVRTYKNDFFNTGINVKVRGKLTRKSEKWRNKTNKQSTSTRIT